MSVTLTRKAVEQLLREVERYLAAVEAFRSEGSEPVWRKDAAVPKQPAL